MSVYLHKTRGFIRSFIQFLNATKENSERNFISDNTNMLTYKIEKRLDFEEEGNKRVPSPDADNYSNPFLNREDKSDT